MNQKRGENTMNYNIIILEVTINLGAYEKTVIYKFTSENEVEKYLNNSHYIVSYKRIAEYKNLSFEEFNEKWKNKE